MMEYKNIKKGHLYLLAVLSGILLWAAWPTSPFTVLIFIAFVPLLIVERILSARYQKAGALFFLLTYITMFTWNLLTTWWIWYASPAGASGAIIANALLMTIPFALFQRVRKWAGDKWGYLSLPVFFLSFEYAHYNWELSWPWLTVGNVFALHPDWVQWYEYTGALGGTLWVFVINIALMFVAEGVLLRRKIPANAFAGFIFLLIVPLGISFIIDSTYEEQGKDVEIVVVQPNIDPYLEKFGGAPNFIPYEVQLARLMDLSKKKATDKTAFVAWPETAMPYGFWESEIDEYESINRLKDFTKELGVTLVTGIDTYKNYPNKEDAPATARINGESAYDVYNAAARVNAGLPVRIYHKSRLVPMVEQMPYPEVFQFVEKLAIDLGGSTGTLGRQKDRDVFYNDDSIGVAPVICYESVFGEFVTEYVQKGANIIMIVTNDAWWAETQGHKQHFHYARLRAIETRRSVARSANTGISGFINQKGEIISRSNYNEMTAMNGSVKANNQHTYYTLHGDYLGRLALFIGIALILSAFVKMKMERKKKA